MPAAVVAPLDLRRRRGGVWSAGGNVLTPALDGGMLVHYGEPVPPVVLDDDEPEAATRRSARSPARRRDRGRQERIDRAAMGRADRSPRSDSTSRAHGARAQPVSRVGCDVGRVGGVRQDREGRVRERAAHADDVDDARREAISYAAYDVLAHRYEHAVGGKTTLACLRAVMEDLGYDPKDVARHGRRPDRLRQPHRLTRSSRRRRPTAQTKPTTTTTPRRFVAQPSARLRQPGRPAERARALAADQPVGRGDAERHHPAGGRAVVHRRAVGRGHALRDEARKVRCRAVARPGPAPQLGPAMKRWVVEVIEKTAALDPSDPATIDISPGAYGHNTLGTNDGKGWPKNPVTGEPYAPEVVPRPTSRASWPSSGRTVRSRRRRPGTGTRSPTQSASRRASSGSSSARGRRSIRSRGTCTSIWRSTAPSTTRRSRPGTSSGAPRRCAPSRSFGGWGPRGSRRIRRALRTIPTGCRSSLGSSRSSRKRAARPESGTRISRSS
jgi:hypothetical protein